MQKNVRNRNGFMLTAFLTNQTKFLQRNTAQITLGARVFSFAVSGVGLRPPKRSEISLSAAREKEHVFLPGGGGTLL